ncbi:hypothetical protein FFI97_001670 [Variovorax sp. KBS0712]|uniref:hypothetical protein n=1 Tax=Variovorax sp. KBS0712 TaxID=2578111 RepID=UPI00111B8E5D|nr:hypothetical protein [Variovorax sp. KBS0712]TSD59066.1 hypothetical protein FFI97_001670 [Variovorax sp. KBS0712]
MPEPRGRRHPLFLRLTKPIDPIYPDAVTPVAWDDDEALEEVEGVVYIVTRQCDRMRAWARQLRALHQADETYKTEEGISPLSAVPLREANLRGLGTSLDLYSEHGSELLSARSAVRAYVTTDLLAVVTERADGDAVGFISFRLKWIVDAFAGRRNAIELEVELDQAWMAPAFRRRRWGETAAIAIAFATRRHVDQIQATTRWPREHSSKLQVIVCADLYSTSGEALLAKCADYVSFQFEWELEKPRLQVSQIIVDGRW